MLLRPEAAGSLSKPHPAICLFTLISDEVAPVKLPTTCHDERPSLAQCVMFQSLCDNGLLQAKLARAKGFNNLVKRACSSAFSSRPPDSVAADQGKEAWPMCAAMATPLVEAGTRPSSSCLSHACSFILAFRASRGTLQPRVASELPHRIQHRCDD